MGSFRALSFSHLGNQLKLHMYNETNVLIQPCWTERESLDIGKDGVLR